MRAVCYLRVSSAGQAERGTIDAQRRDLPAFVARQGWQLVRPVGTYVDDGRTARAGHLQRRTGLLSLLRDLGAGGIDVVVVADLDRLTRSEDLTERGAILGALQRHGVRVASVSTGQVLDLSSSLGDLMSGLQAFFAAEDNRKRSQRIAAGKLTAIARGWKPSGPTPYGLDYDRATHTWSVDPTTSAIARQILERVAAGESTEAIAIDLERQGAPRPRSQIWLRERVWRIATLPHLSSGRWCADVDRDLWIEVPLVVAPELWRRAQARLAESGRRGLRRTKHVYLLEGRARCASCGQAILIRSPRSFGAGRQIAAAYVCRGRKLSHHQIPVRCEAPPVPVAELDERIWQALTSELARPGLAAQILELERSRQRDAGQLEAQLAAARAELSRLAAVERAILRRHSLGSISSAALDHELAVLGQDRGRAEAAAQAAELDAQRSGRAQVRIHDLATTLRDLGEALRAADGAARAEVVRAVVAPGSALLECYTRELELPIQIPTSGVDQAEIALGGGAGCSSTLPDALRFRLVV